ncbi:MAG: NADPH-dependent 7-cyano-7-deazaguanine reductase [Turneriella sp.]|nr:NADPH-dependent 7-cyano-7-deazaguanine reductase [Turneriella sp.]
MEKNTAGSYEGRQNHIRSLSFPAIEVFENIYADKEYSIHIEFPEFTAICPKTGLPDFGIVSIEYFPDKWCLELKSLKEYFLAYRNVGIFHENVVNRVMDDIVAAAQMHKASVVVKYGTRGGIVTTVSRSYTR